VGLVVGLLFAEELPAEPLGVERRAVGAGEDPAVVVVDGAEQALDLGLAAAMWTSISTVPASSRIVWPAFVLGSSFTTTRWSTMVTWRDMIAVAASRSRSSHLGPSTSPRREPEVARNSYAGR